MPPRKGRKLILIREDLLEKAIKICAKEGKTMFSFTNTVFEEALKAHEMKTSLSEVLEFYSLMQFGKKIDLIMLPSSLIDHMIKRLYSLDKEELMKAAYESGRWLGKCVAIEFQERKIEVLKDLFKKCALGLSDFSILNNEEQIEVKCISPRFSHERTMLISKFFEGTFSSLGYKLVKDESFKGVLFLTFIKKNLKKTRAPDIKIQKQSAR